VKNPVRQTLQFVPTASFDKSNEAVPALVSKIQGLLKSKDWNQFAAARFVDITNELRRMDKASLDQFKANTGLK
jgi:negative regulator of replication initiation